MVDSWWFFTNEKHATAFELFCGKRNFLMSGQSFPPDGAGGR
jgi:hypothetical protein